MGICGNTEPVEAGNYTPSHTLTGGFEPINAEIGTGKKDIEPAYTPEWCWEGSHSAGFLGLSLFGELIT